MSAMPIVPALIVLISTSFILPIQASESGKDSFDSVCSDCHSGGFKGFMSGAPEIGDNEDWKGRLAGGVEEASSNVFGGTEDHEAMKEENLSIGDVEGAIEFIIKKTSVLESKK